MRYGWIQRTMWALFQRQFQNALKDVCGVEDGRAVMRRAKSSYREILSRVTEFERGDHFLVNLLSAAMFAAVMLELPERPGVEKAADYYAAAMGNSFAMKFAARHSGSYTKWGREALKRRAELSEKRYEKNPYTWVFTVEDGETLNQYSAVFHTCGILRLMRELGLEDLTPALCRFDYDMAAMNRTVFMRTQTLASGGRYCDGHYNHRMP